MEKLVIEGGVELNGEITVSGSKNAALPILMAALLPRGPITFTNVPNLADIRTTCKLLSRLGCHAEFTGANTVRVECGEIIPEAPYDLVKTMRASVLCLGPLIALCGHAKVSMPGGCAIGARPIDLHLRGLEAMGCEFELAEGYVKGRVDRLRGAHITLDFPTVGGTEHLMSTATLAEGTTVIENAAREPEIEDLANFLNACGAKISGHGTSVITIEGVSELQGTDYRIMPDRIEAGTFMVAGPITGGEVVLRDCPFGELEAVVAKLRSMGVWVNERSPGEVVVRRGDGLRGVDLETQPYPGFPTDMQAQMMALMTLADGVSTVEEKIFENRFMHVMEMVRMGANIKLKGRTAVVRGVGGLTGAPVMASDLRASASLVLCGLAAKGTTEVQRIYHLDRGYESIEAKLGAVGARIKRVKGD